MANLVNISDAKTYIGATDTSDDQLIYELVKSVSARIIRMTGYQFAANDYYEWHSGFGESKLSLRQVPVIRVNRIAYGGLEAFSVNYSGSGIHAYIATTMNGLSPSGVNVVSVSAAGVTTTNTLSFSTYPTASTLVTAIDALSDWTATLLNDCLIQYVHPFGGQSANGQTVRALYADQDESAYEVDYEAGLIGYTDHGGFPWGSGYGDSFGVGAIHQTTSVPVGYRNVCVHYRAGYETVPADVELVCWEMVAEAYRMRGRDTSLQSESLGDYSYTLADRLQMTQTWLAKLAPYSRGAVA